MVNSCGAAGKFLPVRALLIRLARAQQARGQASEATLHAQGAHNRRQHGNHDFEDLFPWDGVFHNMVKFKRPTPIPSRNGGA